MSTGLDASLTGVKDKVVVWGNEGCTQCELTEMRLRANGFQPARGFMDDLHMEPPILRNEIMVAYSLQGSLPVVQVNNMALPTEDAYSVLGIYK